MLQEKIDGIVLPMKNSLGQSSPPNHIGGFLNIFKSM